MAKDKSVQTFSFGNELECVREAQEGNMKAFENLVTLYEGYVYNLCYNVFFNKLDSQDATQEIFVKIYNNIKTFKFNSQFKTWVYRIAINTCIDEYKKKKKRIFEISDNDEDGETFEIVDVKTKTPEELLVEKEIRFELKDIIKSLPLKYRTCIVLRDMQGLSYEEISETLNLNINTVKVRVNRGRIKIKDKFIKLERKKKIEKEEIKKNLTPQEESFLELANDVAIKKQKEKIDKNDGKGSKHMNKKNAGSIDELFDENLAKGGDK